MSLDEFDPARIERNKRLGSFEPIGDPPRRLDRPISVDELLANHERQRAMKDAQRAARLAPAAAGMTRMQWDAYFAVREALLLDRDVRLRTQVTLGGQAIEVFARRGICEVSTLMGRGELADVEKGGPVTAAKLLLKLTDRSRQLQALFSSR